MSCFTHSPQFFRELLDVLTVGECRSHTLYESGLDYGVTDRVLREWLWRVLSTASAAQSYAYQQRYRGEGAVCSALSGRVPAMAFPRWKMVDAVKALTSVLYQCDEGNTRENALYAPALATLESLRNTLAMVACSGVECVGRVEWLTV